MKEIIAAIKLSLMRNCILVQRQLSANSKKNSFQRLERCPSTPTSFWFKM